MNDESGFAEHQKQPCASDSSYVVSYFHTEGGIANTEDESVCFPSANLVDFLAFVISRAKRGYIYVPKVAIDKPVIVPLPAQTNSIQVPLSYDGTLWQRLLLLVKYPVFLLGRENKQIFRNTTHFVVMGYDYFGFIAAMVNMVFGSKNVSFIVRGNRPKTVRTSSRSPLNKAFTLARLFVYENFMVRWLKQGRADIWFQGQEKYEYFRSKLASANHSRLNLLNAVLRDLPEPSSTTKAVDLLFLGHVNVEKGIFDLLEALMIVVSSGHNVSLRVVGGGSDLDSVKTYVVNNNLSDYVTLVGFKSELQEIVNEIATARVFVLPSYTEGLPRAMIESMALGTPVLVTPVGGIPYVVEDGVNGFLVPKKSPKELAEKIVSALSRIENSGFLEEMTSVAKKDAVQFGFDVKSIEFLNRSIGAGGSVVLR